MKNVVLNNNLNLTIPEGFTEITAAEAQEMNVGTGPAPMWNIMNSEDHTVVTASWFKGGWIMSHFYNAKDMAKTLLNKCKPNMKVESPYACTYSDIKETSLDGNKAYAYTCSYRALTKDAEMVDMVRETVVVKAQDVFYVFQAVRRDTRNAMAEESILEVYDSVQFAAA